MSEERREYLRAWRARNPERVATNRKRAKAKKRAAHIERRGVVHCERCGHPIERARINTRYCRAVECQRAQQREYDRAYRDRQGDAGRERTREYDRTRRGRLGNALRERQRDYMRAYRERTDHPAARPIASAPRNHKRATMILPPTSYFDRPGEYEALRARRLARMERS